MLCILLMNGKTTEKELRLLNGFSSTVSGRDTTRMVHMEARQKYHVKVQYVQEDTKTFKIQVLCPKDSCLDPFVIDEDSSLDKICLCDAARTNLQRLKCVSRHTKLSIYDVIYPPDQSVQQHFVEDEGSLTISEFVWETINFIIFTLFWPIYLFRDLVLFFKSKNTRENDATNVTVGDHETLNLGCFIQYQKAAKAALHAGNVKCLEWLLDQGVDVTREELIFAAIEDSKLQCIQLLLRKGADLYYENTAHMTPLMHAVWHNKPDIVTLLLDFDPLQIRQKDSLYQRLPLDFCTDEALNVKMIQTLVEHGADINLSPDLLLTAVYSGGENNGDVIHHILQWGLNEQLLNRRCSYRSRGMNKVSNVLLELVKRGKLRSLREILHYPIDIQSMNEKRQNALDIVCDIINANNTNHNVSSTSIEDYKAIRDVLIAAGLQTNHSSYNKAISWYSDISLQNFCRTKIRLQLMQCNSKENLFLTVPRIPLPSGGTANYIRSYILYHHNIS